jgi:hypothetical protein
VSRKPRRDVFRTTAGLRWVIVGVTMLFVALLGISFVTGPPTLFYGFVAMTVFGVLGIVETIVTRVELHDDRIVAVAFFTRRTFSRDEITSVTWAKGSPVSLQINGTTWAHLPNTGHSSQKIVGAIRAWLNEGGAGRPRLPADAAHGDS